MSNENEVIKAIGLFERKCVICGKEFEATTQYVFHDKDKYYCSYTCSREYHRQKDKNRKRKTYYNAS